jgi:indolepyruvate ferredoxin oxidoreductase alpha subunit
MVKVLREEMLYEGVSVVIPRRECIQTLARSKKDVKVKVVEVAQ